MQRSQTNGRLVGRSVAETDVSGRNTGSAEHEGLIWDDSLSRTQRCKLLVARFGKALVNAYFGVASSVAVEVGAGLPINSSSGVFAAPLMVRYFDADIPKEIIVIVTLLVGAGVAAMNHWLFATNIKDFSNSDEQCSYTKQSFVGAVAVFAIAAMMLKVASLCVANARRNSDSVAAAELLDESKAIANQRKENCKKFMLVSAGAVVVSTALAFTMRAAASVLSAANPFGATTAAMNGLGVMGLGYVTNDRLLRSMPTPAKVAILAVYGLVGAGMSALTTNVLAHKSPDQEPCSYSSWGPYVAAVSFAVANVAVLGVVSCLRACGFFGGRSEHSAVLLDEISSGVIPPHSSSNREEDSAFSAIDVGNDNESITTTISRPNGSRHNG